MKHLFLYTLLLLLINSLSVAGYAQQQEDKFDLRIQINDKQTKEPLEFALIYLTDGNQYRDAICNENGKTSINKLPKGKYKLTASLLGYKKWENEISIDGNKNLNILLSTNSNELNEVVVTASESKGLTSSSIIDHKAMQHLQPSSFTDLLELLPGGKSQDPNFRSMNAIKIREVGVSNSKYDISSLGTSFVIDGTPVSTDADMQYLSSGDHTIAGITGYTDSWRSSVNKGVDMRSISTDQIESVEIVRGIPSVQYGDLTGGLVRIERKKSATPWAARLKVDGFSKLFAVNKGYYFKNKGLTLNFGIDFLDSKNSPVNSYESYQRLTYSIRLGKNWNKESFALQWQSNFDQAHTFDKIKVDPNMYDDIQESADLDALKQEKYRSKYDRFSLANNFILRPKTISFLKSIDLNTSVAYQKDKIEQTNFKQLSSLTLTIPSSDETGIADGIFLPNKYLANHDVDGKPLNIFLKAKANFEFTTNKINHKAIIGTEYSFDKNYGKGQIINRFRPPSGEDFIRPRKYSDIPAKQNLNFFVEDEVSMPIGNNVFKLNAGIRGMSMVGMDSRYKMNGKFYLDPRLNTEWSFPAIDINGKDFNISLSGGIGWHTKFPTLLQIYPDYVYRDFVRLNYYDVDNPEQSRVNYETVKTKTINYNIEPARNMKWEVRLNFRYDNNNLSVTYFREKMTNGFRSQTMSFMPVTTRLYYSDKDSVVIDPSTNQPDLDKSKYKNLRYLLSNNATGNDTRIDKEGIEFTLSTKRLENLKTRLTITGAWFRTKYLNSGVIYNNISPIIGGERVNVAGIYDNSGGYYKEQVNTNFMFDTYIPSLGFEFSTSFQCQWFRINQNLPETRYPFAYIDASGMQHPYTEADRKDPVLQFLMRESNPELYIKQRIPFGMDINLKASKKIKDIMRISLFVNKLLDYYPVYKVNGAEIKRTQNPYFGMELNITL
ncbi:MAG: carboxypeptidase-like regulatory domain-containing protein [Prevotella sp.]|jgi:outer membrane receptor for ferrienterochelin and colicin|nr:carboxypeptidase-like regulatory domain-containing protein [Prevotella sp.]